MAKKKDVFKVLTKKKKAKQTTKAKKEVSPTKDTKAKIAYILATMRFKKNTIMFVRSLSKMIENGKKLSKVQSKTLDQIYTEWMAGRPKILKNKKAKVAKKALRG